MYIWASRISRLKMAEGLKDDEERINELLDNLFGIFKHVGYLYPKYDWKMILNTILYVSTVTSHGVFMIVSLFHLTDDIHSVFFNVVYMLLALLASSLTLLLVKIRPSLKALLAIIASEFFTYDEPIDAAVVRAINARLKSEFKILLAVPACSAVAGLLVCFKSAIDEYFGIPPRRNDVISYSLPLPCWYPFSTEDGHWMKYGALVGQGAFVYFVLVGILSAEAMFVAMSHKIFYQLQILTWSVENFESRTEFIRERYREDARFQRRYSAAEYCVIENIRHHQIIRKCIDMGIKISQPMLFQAWCIGTLTIALTLFEVSQVNLSVGACAASISMTVSEILNMFVLSKIGQQMNNLTDNLQEKVNFMRWYTMNVKTKRLTSIFMVGATISNSFTAGGLFQMNFDSFSSAMNTAYSFFNVLNASKNKFSNSLA